MGSCSESDLNGVPIPLTTSLDWGDGTTQTATSGTHTYSAAGTYTVTVTGIDDAGQTGSATAQVTVTVNQPPTCTLSVAPSTGPAPLTATAYGYCTDPDSNIVSTEIVWGDGTSTQGSSGTHVYVSPGTYTAEVVATDSFEQTGTASQQVVVTQSVNQPPTCTLSVAPASGTAPLMVTATGSCVDPENKLVSTSLDWGDGTTQAATSGTHTYSAAGTYTVTVTGIDDAGQKGTATAQVTVTVNQPPTCTLTVLPSSGTAPLLVTATGSCTDPENKLVSTSLDWGDGTTQAATSGTHTYATPGTYTVTVTATDSSKLTGTATQTVTVTQANRPPTCTLSVTPTTGSAPLTVNATGNCTDPDGNLETTVLTWGDGAQQNEPSGTHTYSMAGTFTVTLTGTDSGGLAGSATATVTVTAATIYLGASNGHILVLNPDGSTAQTLDTTLSGTITGMAFDAEGTLYVTDFTVGNVTRFAINGTLMGTFGSGYDCQPESATFDKAGNLYVGLAGCKKNVLKIDPSGNLADSYPVTIEDQGADWIDLSADGCTLFYTSEGTRVMRYNVCGKKQLGDFAAGLHHALAVRILPDGGLLVSDYVDIKRLDANGVISNTYDQPGEDCWVDLTLDPDGKTFWAADACTSHVYHLDIATGSVLKMLSPSAPANSVYGIAVNGQSGASNTGMLAASPQTANVTAGGSITFTVTLQSTQNDPGPLMLTCSNLPVGMKCTFNPPIITNGGSSTLTISTSNQTSSARGSHSQAFFAWFASAPFTFGLIIFTNSLRKRRRWMWLALIVIAAVLVIIACGSSNTSSSGLLNPAPPGTPQPGTTPAGTYNISVNAGNGPSLATSSVTLTVK
jgi:PKD repeat protein